MTKGQRFTKLNTQGKPVEVIVRQATRTTVTFDVMPLPYWWEEGGSVFGKQMRHAEFNEWLTGLRDAPKE